MNTLMQAIDVRSRANAVHHSESKDLNYNVFESSIWNKLTCK